MALIERMLRQRAAYWPPLVDDRGRQQFDEYGQRRYGAPVEVRVRWEPREQQMLDANQEKFTSTATVYVGQDVAVGGLLRFGTLATVEIPEVPRENSGVLEIKQFVKMPNLRVTRYLRTAYL